MSTSFSRHWRLIALSIVGAIVVGFIAIALIIGRQVEDAITVAQSSQSGEPVEALISLAVSEEAPLPDRNSAIWALGQLGALEALPVLESLLAGASCDHDSAICQYTLQKAIKACSGGFNLGAVIWRHGDLAVR